MDDPVLDLPLSTYPHPSSAYVRWYYRCRLHNLLAASVPRPVYLAVREWFDDVVRSRLDRPPVMAYDSKPVSLSRALGLFEYLTETLDLPVGLEFAAKIEQALCEASDAMCAVFARDEIRTLAREFALAGVGSSDQLDDVAKQHGWAVNAGDGWFVRRGHRVSRYALSAALELAKAGAALSPPPLDEVITAVFSDGKRRKWNVVEYEVQKVWIEACPGQPVPEGWGGRTIRRRAAELGFSTRRTQKPVK